MQLWNQRRGISVDENGIRFRRAVVRFDDVTDARR